MVDNSYRARRAIEIFQSFEIQSPYGLQIYCESLPTVPRKLVTVGYIRVALRAQHNACKRRHSFFNQK
jgi:hypothetical protein